MYGRKKSRIRNPGAEKKKKKRAVAPEIVIHVRYPPVLLVESPPISTVFLFVCFAPSPGPSSSNYFASCAFPICLSLSLSPPACLRMLFVCLRLVMDTAQPNEKHKGARNKLPGSHFLARRCCLRYTAVDKLVGLVSSLPQTSTPTKRASLSLTHSLALSLLWLSLFLVKGYSRRWGRRSHMMAGSAE
ncbi:hypothetical protein M440DRAFT_1038115 [Trichoderma longibrachiatum ATCC 18648]|uniref:Uncharacterized protein n=1 Tax=Trichoderma longibrachiatum ATCC 18648 TaxID=983965 RepID=A0A2T4C029_TRILO|nr:hypothetical protein M440DRAFT_1038115 [Trichoderma longibrachiatum ATCC 18648]